MQENTRGPLGCHDMLSLLNLKMSAEFVFQMVICDV